MSERPRLLVVDDEAGLQRMMQRWAEREGVDLIETTTSVEGFAAATATLPDLILLDLSLPDENGLSLLGRLKAEPRTASIPVVCWSGESATDEREVLAAGAVAFFDKTAIVQTFQKLAELLRSG